MRSYDTQRGALVLEALAAVCVFSLGVLGTLALQAQAMRSVDAARYRAEAASLAQTLLAMMATADAATLAARYSSSGAGEGYAAFVRLARRLPGADRSGNEPVVNVSAGPSNASRRVAITLYWQLPDDVTRRRHDIAAVVGRD
jgi:type IV pilus assembly protein PilV